VVASLPLDGENDLASKSTTKGSVALTHHPRERSCRKFSPSSLDYTVTYVKSFQRSRQIYYPRFISVPVAQFALVWLEQEAAEQAAIVRINVDY
jgi:hypothetical protein